ncbi:unnamed protein product [Symbiodinium sp. CCMP2456]|nr:unnamed protein product [Symbiodinium sp. CCMP2456]
MAQLVSLRLLLAFLLAACGRGTAPVGFVQHLPAIKTLQGPMGEMAKKARRLQMGMDQECMTKCPGLLFMMTDLMSGMQTNPPAGDNASDATAGFDALATMMGAMFTAMCKHSAAMTCMMTECVDPNAAPANGDAGAIGVDSLQQFMPCLCDACPEFMDLFTSLGSTAVLLENVTNMTEVGPQALTVICPMVSATECLTTNAACSAFVQSNDDLGQRTQHVHPDQTSRPANPNKELLVATGLQADSPVEVHVQGHCVRTFSKFPVSGVLLFIRPQSHTIHRHI